MLKEILKKDEIAAMKARDKARVSVLRLVNSEIKAYEVNNREDIPVCPGKEVYPLEEYLTLIEKDLQESLDIALRAGISKDQIILDPGIGFAKDLDMNINGVAYIERLKKFEMPILLGISRKSLIGKSLNLEIDEREEATIALNVIGRMHGCHIFRVHNVLGNVRALKMTDVILNAKTE